ncbi:19615_t:CDS:2 [Dentiscutata erythropus]|uniref:19615_t:CDS:1 n=1 Tax=Dentiscutata erythropus TaxID=1348616 RepID=A0A9N9BQ37_9GLOM|nr:19615_t:CDS:2 [Dentiscutata erythropus]
MSRMYNIDICITTNYMIYGVRNLLYEGYSFPMPLGTLNCLLDAKMIQHLGESYLENTLYNTDKRHERHLLWEDIIGILCEIINGLKRIHDNGLYHGNLHGGNLLIENELGSVGKG